MVQIKVEIDEDEFDRLIVKDLISAYNVRKNDSLDTEYNKKLLKALKRVIEYYGGSVDNG